MAQNRSQKLAEPPSSASMPQHSKRRFRAVQALLNALEAIPANQRSARQIGTINDLRACLSSWRLRCS